MTKRSFIYLFLIIVLGCISLFIGVKDITPIDLIRNNDDEMLRVFLISRVPRLMAIICVGISMSIAGAIMQSITSNRFVSPTTASTMDWARLGILVAIMLFPSASVFTKMIIATIFAFGGSMLFIRLLRVMRLKDQALVPLIGMMLGSVVGSVTTYIAYWYDLIQNLSSWLQGSFAMILKGRYELLYIILPLILIAAVYANRFTIVSMGNDFSENLGVSYNKVVSVGILISSLITSVTVATVGTIPFIGLIVPNLVRKYRGDHLKGSMWEISLLGGLFLLVCDIIARLAIYPFEIPISVVAGIIGTVFFLFLLLKKPRKSHAKKSA